MDEAVGMSDFWHTVAVMVYLSVLAAITVVAVVFAAVEWWRGRGGSGGGGS